MHSIVSNCGRSIATGRTTRRAFVRALAAPLAPPDQSAAMVLSRSVGAMRTFDPVNSIDVLVSGGLRSGPSPFTRRSNPNNNTNTDLEHWCLGGGGGGAAGQRGDHSFASRTGAQGSGAPVTGSSRPVSVSVVSIEWRADCSRDN